MVFGGVTGYVDLGSRVLDGTSGVSLLLWARLAAPTNNAHIALPPSYARMFHAGSGCVTVTSAEFGCEATLFMGTGSSGANLYGGASAANEYSSAGAAASARGEVAEVSLDVLPGGVWVALALTVDAGGEMRLYADGVNVFSSNGASGLPAALYPAVYIGRGQNPTDGTRWRGALSNVQLYFTTLSADAVAGLAVGDATSCVAAPPPPNGAASTCLHSKDTFPFARVTAGVPAVRWMVHADRVRHTPLILRNPSQKSGVSFDNPPYTSWREGFASHSWRRALETDYVHAHEVIDVYGR